MKHYNKQSGFTLIEIAVAITVFMIFIGIILGSFINLIGAQIEANRYRKVYAELNEVLSLISTDVRDYAIDYGCFKTAVCDPNIHNYQVIAFVSKDGLERHILSAKDVEVEEKELVDLQYAVQTRASRRNEWPAVIYRSLETENTDFYQFDLTLTPENNPYDVETRIEAKNLFQPSLTINALAKAKAYPERQGIPMQTTISSRFYNVRF